MNNCIGKANYRLFLCTVTLYLLLTTFYLFIAATRLTQVTIVAPISLAIQLLRFSVLLLLLVWHAWINHLNMTTFDYLNELTILRSLKRSLHNKEITQEAYEQMRQKVIGQRGRPTLEVRTSQVIL